MPIERCVICSEEMEIPADEVQVFYLGQLGPLCDECQENERENLGWIDPSGGDEW